MIELRTLENAVKLLDEWMAHAKKLERELVRAEEDRDWWMQQSNFWHAELKAIVDMWVAEKPVVRRSKFDEIEA